MSDQRPPAAAASGAGGPRRRACALLDRSPQLLGPGEELLGGADYAIKYGTPPKLSVVRPPLLPLDDADIDARIHCSDRDGNLCLSLWEPEGRYSLLVCRAGTAKVDLLPAFPEDLAAVGFSPAHCWGIHPSAAAPGSGDYVVAQLQRAPAGSSSPSSMEHHIALLYSSASRSWTTKDVLTERPRRFEAHSDEEGWVTVGEVTGGDKPGLLFEVDMVISVDKAGSSSLVFADSKHGLLLLLDPMEPRTARMVLFPPSGPEDGEMPEAAGDARKAAARRCVSCTQGSLCVVQIHNDKSVSISTLEEEDKWVCRFRVPRLNIIWSHAPPGHRLALANAELGVGPVNPTNRNMLTFYRPDGGGAFTVEVVLGSGDSLSVRFCGEVDANAGGSCLDVVASTFDSTDPAAAAGAQAKWRKRLTGGSRRVARKAWQGVKSGRKNFDKISPGAQAVVSFGLLVGVPHAPAAAGAVAGLVAANKTAELGERFVSWWRKQEPRQDSDMTIATVEEAGHAIHKWVVSNNPPGMKVYVAPGLTEEQAADLRDFIIQQGAKELLPVPLGSDFVHVPSALPDFGSAS